VFSRECAPLEDMDVVVDNNSAWEMIRQNIKLSAKEILYYFELQMHKTWFDGGCSKLLVEMKYLKLQWLEDPSEVNGDNLINVGCKANRHFRNKKREYLKDKIIELTTSSMNENVRDLYRGRNTFKRGCQRRNNFAKDENGDLFCIIF
jgi:hypothetical protein